MLDILGDNRDLVESQGIDLYRLYLKNVLGYGKDSINNMKIKSTFEFANNSSGNGYVTYEIDENGNKKLTGFLIRINIPFTKKHIITIICGSTLSKVNKLLKTSLRSVVYDYYYYFPENEEIQILFEQNGFILNKFLEKSYRQDIRIMELKYIPIQSEIINEYSINNN